MANRGVALISLTHWVILGSLLRVITRRDLSIEAGSQPSLPFLEEEY
jgi:hypothetical protein